jgi:hypothetical protein
MEAGSRNEAYTMNAHVGAVGRSGWPAVDGDRRSATRGSRADGGVSPTIAIRRPIAPPVERSAVGRGPMEVLIEAKPETSWRPVELNMLLNSARTFRRIRSRIWNCRPKARFFHRPPLTPEIAVVAGATELSGRGTGPRRGVQYDSRIGIEAAAVEV